MKLYTGVFHCYFQQFSIMSPLHTNRVTFVQKTHQSLQIVYNNGKAYEQSRPYTEILSTEDTPPRSKATVNTKDTYIQAIAYCIISREWYFQDSKHPYSLAIKILLSTKGAVITARQQKCHHGWSNNPNGTSSCLRRRDGTWHNVQPILWFVLNKK